MTPADKAPRFFAKPSHFRRWFERHHASADELLVGFYKRASGTPSITWPESVDEALCFGWIDGVRRSIDDVRYTIRFTPRRRGSVWSARNIARAGELIAQGRMTPAGLRAFEKRTEERTRRYSYEQGEAQLAEEYEGKLRAEDAAWRFFQMQPSYYRRQCVWWVISAKREETRQRRLETLIRDSAAGQRIPPFRIGEKAT